MRRPVGVCCRTIAKTGARTRNGTSVHGTIVPATLLMPKSVSASGKTLTEAEPR
jgi:hypothetical protein